MFVVHSDCIPHAELTLVLNTFFFSCAFSIVKDLSTYYLLSFILLHIYIFSCKRNDVIVKLQYLICLN